MKSFLLEIAEQTVRQHRTFDWITFIFPNRRAILYFRKYFSSLLDKPVFSPRLLTIEDFITSESALNVPDRLELIHRLYIVYYQVIKASSDTAVEPFDQFYFWGDMLLRDFDEADRYMVDAAHLFRDLSYQKELDSSFDFLTDEQKKFLTDFWGTFDEGDSPNKKKFLKIWTQLPEVYSNYKLHLKEHGLAYDGMLHREVAEQVKAGKVRVNKGQQEGAPIRFVGFNALTLAEETIITALVEKGFATAHWDIDAYYINNNAQEAGTFFRKYQQHPVLGKTFSPDIPSNLIRPKARTSSGEENKSAIKIYGASQSIGQAKLMSQLVAEELKKGANPEEILIVLADEKLLIPVLHGVAGTVDTLNVTMGFPLSSTPLFNLIELLIELQIATKEKHFNHKQVIALLGHPYVVAADAALANSKSKEILYNNWVSIPPSFLATSHELHRQIFVTITSAGAINYLREIVTTIGSLETITDIDKEYALRFIKLFNRMEEVLQAELGLGNSTDDPKEIKRSLRSFLRLFRQLVRSQKIPFSGEPLKGLQVMGVLETRNLDFKNVFILSLNEGVFPSSTSKGSYIPHNIRRAYSLPTTEHQDAIYSYLFYRMLQRAENVFLFYNSETDILGQGEMSRYLHQLLFEASVAGLTLETNILHNPLQPYSVTPIVVQKDETVFNQLARFCAGSGERKYLSPSTLNDYIDCRLKFYFRHVARIREAKEVEEELDARILGNFLHQVMEMFYVELIRIKGGNTIEAADIVANERNISAYIDKVFMDMYRLPDDKPVSYEGQSLIVREVVKRFVDEILKKDKEYAPFEMLALESQDMTYTISLQTDGKPVVLLGGSIDRADFKNKLIRVVDYKTGKDKLEFESIESLFRPNEKRNKAAFQTMMYALLYYQNRLVGTPHSAAARAITGEEILNLLPGLFNRVNLFDEDFRFGLRIGGQYVGSAIPLLPEFERNLTASLEELFDLAQPFDQTTNLEACRNCSYQRICYR